MEAKVTDFAKLNEALEKFGSLQKANVQLGKANLMLKKENAQFNQENNKLAATRDKLTSQIENINTKKEDYQGQLQSLYSKIKMHNNQYELFCSFIAMVIGSPSVTHSLNYLVMLFQNIIDNGWYLSKSAEDMRSLFIRTVMGDYLKSFRCDACGAKFITNKKLANEYLGNGYYCPVCHYWYAVKEDDSFLEAFVSGKQLEGTQYLEKVLEEYEVLEPFKAFKNVPCEICHKPITEWDDYSVKLVLQGIGCGHTACWYSESGKTRELLRTLQKIKRDMK